jgi:putative SOS response-associated peptidase YedK
VVCQVNAPRCDSSTHPEDIRCGGPNLNGICQAEHCTDTGRACDPVQPGVEATKQRTLDALKWGLIPNWATDPKIAYKTINARAESVDTAPSYREAFKKRRCLIPSDGFYEWKKVVGGKIPYSISMKDDSPFVFAGLWEGWKDPANGEWLRTCTIITGEPNDFVERKRGS